MTPQYTVIEFNNAKSTDKLSLTCEQCYESFELEKKFITSKIKLLKNPCRFCSTKCAGLAIRTKQNLICSQCDKEFEKIPAEISKNNFCSKSCAVTYNNKHKTTGTRRSKLEVYLEEQLSSFFPDLLINYNKKETINSELDIYIPSLKLAFELNGIFHYEPIYGTDKLNQIQNNDNRKFQACLEQNIELCIIDASGLKYFKPTNAQKYLDIIVNIINQRTSC
jgi:hypothetical protein